jgi:hypothetical protein
MFRAFIAAMLAMGAVDLGSGSALAQAPPSSLEKNPQKIAIDLQMNRNAKPYFGSAELADGFAEPYRKSVVAGGNQMTTIGQVSGWITESPDFIVDYKAGKNPLHFYVLSPGDTVLFVFGPGGLRLADDDSAGALNPLVTIKEPRSGQYQIWVGTFEKAHTPATLVISASPPPIRKATNEKNLVTSVPDEVLKQLLQDAALPAVQDRAGYFVWKEQENNDEYKLISLGRGRVLLITAVFEGPVSLDRINLWNDRQALSRAIFVEENGKKTARLEADLNCSLGIAPTAVSGFIDQFKLSARAFREHLRKEPRGN